MAIDPLDPGTIDKVLGLAKYVGKTAYDFMWPYDPDFRARLQTILADVESGEVPRRTTAELLSLVLRDILARHDRVPLLSYREIVRDVIGEMSNLAGTSSIFWDDCMIYVRRLKEVWICCEPCLELLDEDPSVFDQLVIQLRHASKVVFHFTNDAYFSAITTRVAAHIDGSVLSSKLHLRIVHERTSRPVALFFLRDGTSYGVAGSFHPIGRLEHGSVKLQSSLPKDWSKYIDHSLVETYKREIDQRVRKP